MAVMQMLSVLGVSFQSTSVAARETLSLTSSEAMELLNALKNISPKTECAILSTCNRTEFYIASSAIEKSRSELLHILRCYRPEAAILRLDCQRYELSSEEAVRHVLRVACGLESAVLGDVQILSQFKECRRIATVAGTARKYLNYVFDIAIETGHRARNETVISHGNASVGSAVVSILRNKNLALTIENKPHVIILGAGKVAESIVRQLWKDQSSTICIINRTLARAQRLAILCNGEARSWSALSDSLASADVIISTTFTTQPILTQAMLANATMSRAGKAPLVIDVGMPRNVEHGTMCDVVDIDNIREQQDDVIGIRHSAIAGVEAIISQSMSEWRNWQHMLPVEAIVKSLFVEINDQQRVAIHQMAHRQNIAQLNLEELIFQPMRRILHRHVKQLRSCNTFGDDSCRGRTSSESLGL